jgi:tubulin epsilon
VTQNITIQIGQCGNQIGYRFWDLALREHATINKSGVFDGSLNTFFRNVDKKGSEYAFKNSKNSQVYDGTQKIKSLRARAILIDTEESVVNEIFRSPIRDVFEYKQYVSDVSGAGNNWAVGHFFYGQKYEESIIELVR